MSNRERWTVYPLLFMTLGIALTDKISKRTNTDTVICKNLVVTDRQSVPQVVIQTTPVGGIVKAQGLHTNVILGHTEKLSGMLITDHKGNVLTGSLAVQPGALVQPPAVKAGEMPAAEAPQEPEPTPQPQQEPEPETGDDK